MYRIHNQKKMLLNGKELRYRSIKYSVSSSQLLRPLQPPNNDYQRHSLTKENSKAEPSHKPSPFFKRSSHHSHLVKTRNTLALSRKEEPLQPNLNSPQNIPMPLNCQSCLLPFNIHCQELENVCQPFPAILKESAIELNALRKQLQNLALRVQQQLSETQQLVAVGSRSLVRQMELSLKAHNGVAVNARDRLQSASELYQQANSSLIEISLQLDELQLEFNS